MKVLIVSILLVVIPLVAFTQNERKIIREGVKDYEHEEFSEAEIRFRNALEIDSTSLPANYNVAGSLYKQEKYDEASEIYNSLTENINSSEQLADTWHNLGNSFVQKQDYEKAIESYKNSLRLRPADQDTKYNLAYAQSMLKKQQEQDKKDEQEKQDENDDKEDEKEQDKKEEENKEEDKDQEEQEDNKDQQDQDNKEDEQKQQPEPKEGISKEEMERMLQAVQQQEKNVLDKVEKEKAKAAKVKTDKDW